MNSHEFTKPQRSISILLVLFHSSFPFILLKTFFCQTVLKQILAIVSFYVQILLGVWLTDKDVFPLCKTVMPVLVSNRININSLLSYSIQSTFKFPQLFQSCFSNLCINKACILHLGIWCFVSLFYYVPLSHFPSPRH